MAVDSRRDLGLAVRIAGASVLVVLANVAFVSLVLWLASYVALQLLVFHLYPASAYSVLFAVADPANWRSPVVLPLTAAFLLGQYCYATRRPVGAVDADAAVGEDAVLAGRVRRLAKQTGVPTPDVVVADAPEANSYTVGRRGNATVVVTRPLVDALGADELDAVLAHELAHVANRDVAVMTMATAPFRLARRFLTALDRLVYLSVLVFILLLHAAILVILVGVLVGLAARELLAVLPTGAVPVIPEGDPAFVFINRAAGAALAVFEPVGLVLLFVPLFSLIPLLATGAYRVLLDPVPRLLARYREFAADRGAARIAGDPGALASALETLDGGQRPGVDARRVDPVAALCLRPGGVGSEPTVGPIRSAIEDKWPWIDFALDRLAGRLVAHPPTADRLERLRAVTAED